MQQAPPSMMNMVPQSTPITTEQIQKCLDENKTLILAILENQNLGKLAECAQYQALLQKNLMYLAAIADGQPQAPAVPSQMPSHPAMQQGGHYMQHPQAAMGAQPGGFPPKSHMQFNPQQMQEQQRQQLQLQSQHALQNHMGIRPSVNNGSQGMPPEVNHGGSSSGVTTGAGGGASARSPDGREGKQDGAEGGSGDGQGNSAGGNNNANGEPSQAKRSEASK